MQTVSTAFNNRAQGYMRPLAWQLRMSFDKAYDDSVTFFTLDTSLLDGIDVLAPSDNNIIAEWDKYAYADYSGRVISMEVTREEIEPYSIVQAYADIVLDNHDGYFTPKSDSPIADLILPRRPLRILMGFGDEVVPLFVGLTEKIPSIDKNARTATFHAMDFLTFIFEKSIDETIMLTDVTTGEVLDTLFQGVGLLPDQYVLDETSFNRIPFFFTEKGTKLGDIVQNLMRAEQGRLYLDELGVIRFLNRQNYPTSTVYSFDKSNTIDYQTSTEDDVINYVKIEADIYAVQTEQSVWELTEAIYVKAGETVEVFADLNDPATSVTTPVYSDIQSEASHFITTLDIEGTVPYTDIVLDSIDVFAKTVKLTFENTGSNNAYVTGIDLWGTPVKVVDTIIVEDLDQASIDAMERRPYEFKTPYIQKTSSAISKAAIIIDDYKDYGSILELDVKGNPALQIGDMLDLDLDGNENNHVITKTVSIMSRGEYRQLLTVKQKDVRMSFILSSDTEDRSLLDGTDVLI